MVYSEDLSSVKKREEEILKQVALIVKKYKEKEVNSLIDDVNLKSYDDFFSNRMLLISIISIGISFKLFELMSDRTPYTESEWAGFLHISKKSLLRYKKNKKQFKPIQSERIIELAEVTHKGVDTFGSMGKFKNWLNTPNYALGNIKPMSLLKDSYGKEMIISQLVRIDHGILI